jgi:FkbM family methyltransferase
MVDALARVFRASGRAGLIDIGVNVGQTLLKLRSLDRRCRYIGFEPNPFCAQLVNELIALNALEHTVIMPVGLSNRSGLVEFVAASEGDGAASMLQEVRPHATAFRKQYIATLVFDDVAADLDIDGIPAVKIDVEGAELEVLSGMRSFLGRARPFVICEVLHAHTPAQIELKRTRNGRLLDLLHELDYVCMRIQKGERLASVTGLKPIEVFPDDVWDPRTSGAVCDYLFVARERLDAATAAF